MVWFDYDAGLAIHRLRDDAVRSARLQRLQSNLPGAQRVSAGCVVVPVAFYETGIEPVLGRRRGVVYVLPEIRPLREGSPAARGIAGMTSASSGFGGVMFRGKSAAVEVFTVTAGGALPASG